MPPSLQKSCRLAILLSASIFLLGNACNESSRAKLSKKIQKGKPNPFVALFMGLDEGATNLYNHGIIRSFRGQSDCQPDCPKVDVWKYRYKPALDEYPDGHIKPITSQKKYWKVPFEARIISMTLFGSQRRYLDGLRFFIKSNDSLKKFNGISANEQWGYETFTIRMYVAKRNPNNPNRKNAILNSTPDDFIEEMFNLGCEIVYVDNDLDEVAHDAVIWRFLVVAEPMEAHQRIRYLVRDLDWLLTAPEGISVGEWINSGLRYHRMQLMPACNGPLIAGLWGGSHEGAGPLPSLKEKMEGYPYRLFYGDDEAFGRDIIWPHMAYSGSVMTHHFAESFFSFMGNPYEGSCGRPTQPYCTSIQAKKMNPLLDSCRDVLLPSDTPYPFYELGSLDNNEPFLSRSDIFDMHMDTERAQKAAKGLSVNPDFQ